MGTVDEVRALLLTARGHLYLSTSCLHGEHRHCRSDRALSGQPKTPNVCKFCPAACICDCHTAAKEATR